MTHPQGGHPGHPEPAPVPSPDPEPPQPIPPDEPIPPHEPPHEWPPRGAFADEAPTATMPVLATDSAEPTQVIASAEDVPPVTGLEDEEGRPRIAPPEEA